jgi:hypothetical protein
VNQKGRGGLPAGLVVWSVCISKLWEGACSRLHPACLQISLECTQPCRSCRRLRSFDLALKKPNQKIAASFHSSAPTGNESPPDVPNPNCGSQPAGDSGMSGAAMSTVRPPSPASRLLQELRLASESTSSRQKKPRKSGAIKGAAVMLSDGYPIRGKPCLPSV